MAGILMDFFKKNGIPAEFDNVLQGTDVKSITITTKQGGFDIKGLMLKNWKESSRKPEDYLVFRVYGSEVQYAIRAKEQIRPKKTIAQLFSEAIESVASESSSLIHTTESLRKLVINDSDDDSSYDSVFESLVDSAVESCKLLKIPTVPTTYILAKTVDKHYPRAGEDNTLPSKAYVYFNNIREAFSIIKNRHLIDSICIFVVTLGMIPEYVSDIGEIREKGHRIIYTDSATDLNKDVLERIDGICCNGSIVTRRANFEFIGFPESFKPRDNVDYNWIKK